MPKFRFILSYFVMFVVCLIPMALFGDGTISILLCAMMNASFTVSMGPVALGVGLLCAFLGATFLTGSASAGIFFALTATLPVLCGWFVYPRKLSFGGKLCATGTAFLVTFSLWEMNFIRLSGESIHQIVEEVANSQDFSTMIGAENMDAFREMANALIPYVVGIIPGFFLIVALVGSYLILSGMNRLVRFADPHLAKGMPAFRELELPRGLAIVFFLALIGAIIAPSQQAVIYCLNACLVIGFLGAVCGLSLVDFYFSRVMRSTMLRAVIYILVMNITVFQPLGILFLIGMVDSFGRFRRPKNRNKGEKK